MNINYKNKYGLKGPAFSLASFAASTFDGCRCALMDANELPGLPDPSTVCRCPHGCKRAARAARSFDVVPVPSWMQTSCQGCQILRRCAGALMDANELPGLPDPSTGAGALMDANELPGLPDPSTGAGALMDANELPDPGTRPAPTLLYYRMCEISPLYRMCEKSPFYSQNKG